MIKIKQKYSEEEIIEQIKEHYSKNPKMTGSSFGKDQRTCSITAVKTVFGTWKNALKKAEIPAIARDTSYYTKEKILKQLKDHYLRNPNMNSESFKKDKTVCAPETVRAIFGSWYEALREAEIPIKNEITKEKIIFQLKKFYKEHSYITRSTFNKDRSVCGSGTVSKYFGGWEKALVAAGLQEKIIYVEYDKEKLLRLLKKKVKTGELRYRTDVEKIDEIPSWTYISQLWTWDELAKLLKLKRRVYAYTDEEIMGKYAELKKKKKYKGVRISSVIMKKETGIGFETVRDHFGGWNIFLRLMNEKEITEMTKVTHTKEEILEMYRKFSIKIGKGETGATESDLDSKDFPYRVHVLCSRFRSLNNMRELLGFEIKKSSNSKYTKKELKVKLLKKYKEYGRKLTQKELKEISKEEEFPVVKTILNHFETTKMSAVWEEVLKDRSL